MLIAQITDLHIVEKDQHWYSHPSTEIKERLEKTIKYLNELEPKPDVVLVSGDLTDEGAPLAYVHLRELMNELKIPFFVIPGNHDRREGIRATFADHDYIPKKGYIQYVIDDYPIRFIGLDTLVEGESYGCLCEESISWLKETLESNQEKPTLIFMHHPPVKIGMKLFDRMHCKAPDSFEQLIKETKNVIGVFAGHYHHLCVTSFGGKLCYLAPSIAPVHYFAHPDHEYVTAIELEDPGITLHRWLGGNSITSHVVRLKEKRERLSGHQLKQRDNS